MASNVTPTSHRTAGPILLIFFLNESSRRGPVQRPGPVVLDLISRSNFGRFQFWTERVFEIISKTCGYHMDYNSHM